jgi:hypothetical protein
MKHIPIKRLGSVPCNVVTAVNDKAEPDSARFRHRLAERPDPIEFGRTPTFDSPTLLRAESSARKSSKVAVRLVVLNIDADGSTHAECAREPSTSVRQ